MLRYKLAEDDCLDEFTRGLDALGTIDVVTRHENRYRDTMMLGRAYAYAEIAGCLRPLVIHWLARIDLPASQRNNPIRTRIEKTVQDYCGKCGGIVQRDIRTEARSIKAVNLARLVEEDIERGDLPNRFLFRMGLQQTLYNQIGKLYRSVGNDPEFDWQQVRVTFEQAG
jgi:hypothetical protein